MTNTYLLIVLTVAVAEELGRLMFDGAFAALMLAIAFVGSRVF